jgi:hypothetical protein
MRLAERSGQSCEHKPVLDLDALSNRQLLQVWAKSLQLLYDRGVVRTHNSPIGDIAEEMVARHYSGVRRAFDQAAWDVAIGEERLQVKACRREPRKSRTGFSPIRHRDGYDAVVLVVFSMDMEVEEAWRVPRAVVNELGKFNAHVNGIKIALTSAVRAHPEVEQLELTDDALD